MNGTNGVQEVKRVNYFEGQHLRVTDFEAEQNYHAQMRHLHNRVLHTWGVADGLEVNIIENDPHNATIAKGMAIDVCGREIVVPTDQVIDIPKGAGETEGDFYLAICYREDCSNDTVTDKCASGFSRKTESFRVAVLKAFPPTWDSDKIDKDCDKLGKDCNKVSQEGSPEIPWVPLAKITLENCKITEIDNSIRSLVKAQFTGSVKIGGDTMYGALIIDRSGVIERNASEATNTNANRIDFLHLLAHDDVQNEREQIGYISTNKNTIGLRIINDFNNPEDLGDFASLKVHDVLADGNVGIGTFTPKHKLEIHGADNSLVILSTASSGTERNAGLELRTTAEDGVTYIDFTKGSTNTEGSGTPDFSGRISYNETNSGAFAILGGNVGIGTANPQGKLTVEAATHINVLIDRTDSQDHMTLTVGSDGTGIHFGNSNRFFISADPYAERNTEGFGNEVFTILSSGNVGVSTPNPGAKLHVRAVEPQARIESFGDRALVQFAKGGALQWDFGVGTGAGNNDFWFGDFTTYRMIIQKGTGNVGIGETNPKHLLHIAGTTPVLRLSSAVNVAEGSKIRFTETGLGFIGAYLHYEGIVNRLDIGMHNTNDSDLANDVASISILRSDGTVILGPRDQQVHIGGNRTGPFLQLNDDLWFSDPQNGTIQIRNHNNSNWGTMVGIFNQMSSRKFKKDITALPESDLDKLLEDALHTEVVRFRFKEDDAAHRLRLGVIAEDSPPYIIGDEGESLSTAEYASMLHGAVKALATKLSTQEKKITAKIKELETKINALEKKRKTGE